MELIKKDKIAPIEKVKLQFNVISGENKNYPYIGNEHAKDTDFGQ